MNRLDKLLIMARPEPDQMELLLTDNEYIGMTLESMFDLMDGKHECNNKKLIAAILASVDQMHPVRDDEIAYTIVIPERRAADDNEVESGQSSECAEVVGESNEHGRKRSNGVENSKYNYSGLQRRLVSDQNRRTAKKDRRAGNAAKEHE